MRRSDRLAIIGFGCLIAQLCAGTVAVSVQHLNRSAAVDTVRGTQTVEQARTNERLSSGLDGLVERVARLESLRIDARLAVLEENGSRVLKIEMLQYGAIVTLIGNLAMSILMVRAQKTRRGQG